MPSTKTLVMVAGEESGDRHAADLAQQLLTSHPDWQISGIGGSHMEKAGVRVINHLAAHGVTGLLEVVRHFRTIKQAFRQIQSHLLASQPDLLILIDYPGFNLRLARWAKANLQTKILYFISPQIWAWKAGRIETIKACVDHMAVILPFEREIYQKADVPVSFVGHPLVKAITPSAPPPVLRSEFGFSPEQQIIALLPGSRVHEVRFLLPIMLASLRQLRVSMPNLHALIPVANSLDPGIIRAYLGDLAPQVKLVSQRAIDVIAASDAVIVASGTASLEAALVRKPMCVLYRASYLTYVVAMRLIRVKYLALANLLAGQMIVPELLQYDCTVEELTALMHRLLTQPALQKRMTRHLDELYQNLSDASADCQLDQLIERMVAG